MSSVEFLELVNESYYKNSADLYDQRYVDDIACQYGKLFDFLRGEEDGEKLSIVDVGAGTGFLYKTLCDLEIEFDKYVYIEPSRYMAELFENTLSASEKSRVTIRISDLEAAMAEVNDLPRKIVVVNSAIHHIVWLSKFLDQVNGSMKEGDFFLIGHEPNNEYKGFFYVAQKILRSLFTNALVRRVPVLGKMAYPDADDKSPLESNKF